MLALFQLKCQRAVYASVLTGAFAKLLKNLVQTKRLSKCYFPHFPYTDFRAVFADRCSML